MTVDFYIADFPVDLLDDAVALHRSAFAGSAHVELGTGYVRRLLLWYASAPDAIAIAAIDDNGQLVGLAVGGSAEVQAAFRPLMMREAAQALMTKPWLFLRRPVRAAIVRRLVERWLTRNESKASVYRVDLVTIAVRIDRTHQGIGRRLMEAFESRAADQGAEVLRLAVHLTNVSAQRLYERAGWSAVKRQPGAGPIEYQKPLSDRAP